MFPHGFLRIRAASPQTAIANPTANVKAILGLLEETDAHVLLLPELALTGYTCGDLFLTDSLLQSAEVALLEIRDATKDSGNVLVIGTPLRVADSLMNVAAVISSGRIQGFVPKSYLPTYHEFYESRHFRAASETDPSTVEMGGEIVPFGCDLLFNWGQATFGIEICEDLWGPIPPSSHAALAGANVLLNLSASNETIGKADWRKDLVRSQSGRCIAAYAYASAGSGESTSDVVFGGHLLIAENGSLIGESRRIGDGQSPMFVEATDLTCDIDLDRLSRDRRAIGTFDDARQPWHTEFRRVDIAPQQKRQMNLVSLYREIDPHPFVPKSKDELDRRCSEILGIQVAGLVKRVSRLDDSVTLSIGVSGGLDSTLALLVAVDACDAMGRSRDQIRAIMMPGFGTTSETFRNGEKLISELGVSRECIDIRSQCVETFRSMGHQPFGIPLGEATDLDELQQTLKQLPDDAADLVFENVQARLRTMLLMTRGFVLGTGDMSEQALGWSTYNADHMSMYNVNTSVPKSLVRFLVRHVAVSRVNPSLSDVLIRISETPISPELLPPTVDGKIRQSTESSVGPYELHDFFLFHFIRHGFTREKILFLASQAKFDTDYSEDFIAATLDRFFARFFQNQFKRNCVPDGPKVGSVSLSPRGDWRMPSDADSDVF